jgi:hypothetical protein
VWVEGHELKISAPKGVLTSELRDELKRHKLDLLGMLAGPEPSKALAITRASRAEPLPLSSTHERLWFLHQLEPGMTA